MKLTLSEKFYHATEGEIQRQKYVLNNSSVVVTCNEAIDCDGTFEPDKSLTDSGLVVSSQLVDYRLLVSLHAPSRVVLKVGQPLGVFVPVVEDSYDNDEDDTNE
jgi:hypothetical protein